MPFKSRWSIPIPDTSLPGLIFKSPKHPQSDTRKCYIDTARPNTHFFTVHGYLLWCKRFAAGLQQSGLKSGDRVLVFSANNLVYPVAFMGIVMAGCVFTGANPTYTPRELAYQLSDSGATYLLCADNSLDTGIAAAESIGMGRDKIFVFNDLIYDGKGEGIEGCRYWGELFATTEEGEQFSWEELPTPEAADKTLALNYSSGTTGVPKGVEISHKNYVSNAIQFTHSAYLDKDYEETTKRTRWMCFLPMYHAMAQNIFIAAALIRQVPVYLMARFEFNQMLENVQKFRISTLTLVPPIVVMLAKHPAVKKYDLSSLEQVGCGAAPLGTEISEEVEALFPKGKIYVRQGWGMTEYRLPPLMRISLTRVNQHGEIWVRGPNIMKGYWNKPEATRETLTPDRWLKTGDIGYVDSSGKFYIIDRKKELIKVKGNQVAPAELEDGEEYPRAYVVLTPGNSATLETAQSIVHYMKDKVAPVKRITGGVIFVDVIPKNPSGKILRKALRDRAKSEIQNGLAASKL
ncbi:conserved hypothetical protein [Uncinocarpus reesii 1704]|uniref:4-coumarate-CoA ligase n=1 Tax=Uncinocarpus reesii (strain UAMH 1704) TaxID=336963 RepID=C4JLE4_UNCRE|nr:uncharacterized protein UREG_03652 [Uncinocarpus reesii 1704]EEP78806.1 conserved hypothetical protein [Uncinocarpus reesii 1704]